MTTSAAVDQYGQTDLEPNRYLWALRRALLLLVGAGLVGGLLLAVLVGEPATTTTTRLLINDASTTLASSRLESAGFAGLPSRIGVTEFLNSWAPLESDFTVGAVEDVTNSQMIILTVTGPSDTKTAEPTSQLLSATESWIGERRAEAAAPVLAVLQREMVSTKARLAELDVEIRALDSSEALRDAYLAERADLTEQRRLAESQRDSLTRYGESSGSVVVLDTAAASTDSRVLWFIVGAVLGALLGAVVVIVRAHTDRRVRCVSELAAVSGSAPLPLVPAKGPERESAMIAVSTAVARLAEGAKVLLVPADDDHAYACAEALIARDPIFTLYSPRDAATTIPAGSMAVIVAASGRTHGDDVARTRAYLRALDCVVVGAVLDGVATNDMRRAMA